MSEAGPEAWIAEVASGKDKNVWLAFVKDRDDALYVGAYANEASAREAAAGYRTWKEKADKAKAEEEARRAKAKAELEAQAAREKAEREEYERLRPEREVCIAVVRSRWLDRVSAGDPDRPDSLKVKMVEEPFALKAEIKIRVANIDDDPISNLDLKLTIENDQGHVVLDDTYTERGTFEPHKAYLRSIMLTDRYGVLAAREVASGKYTLHVTPEGLTVNGERTPSPRDVERSLKHNDAGWTYNGDPIDKKLLESALTVIKAKSAPKDTQSALPQSTPATLPTGFEPRIESDRDQLFLWRKEEEARQKATLMAMKESARNTARTVLEQIGIQVEPVDTKNGRFTFKLTAHNGLNEMVEPNAFQITLTRDDMIIKEFQTSVFMRIQPGKDGTARFAYNDRDAEALYNDIRSGKAKVEATLLTIRRNGAYVSVEDNRLLPNNLAF